MAHGIFGYMKTSAPALVPFLRSDAQARLLAALMLRPEREATLTELAIEMGVNTSSAYREVERMVGSGVLADRTLGRTRLVRADLSYRYFEPLAQILAGSYGPVEAVRSALDGVDGVQDALIFGSYAARFLGHAGPSPQDIDVLVVGSPPGRQVRRAASVAEESIGLPVQITVLTPEEWASAESGLVREVKTRPTIPVDLGEPRGTHTPA